MNYVNLNEMLKLAGLPEQQVNEAKSLDRLRNIAEKINAMQRLFSTESTLVQSIEADKADMGYVKDIQKLLDNLEEALTELQKSVDHMDQQ